MKLALNVMEPAKNEHGRSQSRNPKYFDVDFDTALGQWKHSRHRLRNLVTLGVKYIKETKIGKQVKASVHSAMILSREKKESMSARKRLKVKCCTHPICRVLGYKAGFGRSSAVYLGLGN